MWIPIDILNLKNIPPNTRPFMFIASKHRTKQQTIKTQTQICSTNKMQVKLAHSPSKHLFVPRALLHKDSCSREGHLWQTNTCCVKRAHNNATHSLTHQRMCCSMCDVFSLILCLSFTQLPWCTSGPGNFLKNSFFHLFWGLGCPVSP